MSLLVLEVALVDFRLQYFYFCIQSSDVGGQFGQGQV